MKRFILVILVLVCGCAEERVCNHEETVSYYDLKHNERVIRELERHSSLATSRYHISDREITESFIYEPRYYYVTTEDCTREVDGCIVKGECKVIKCDDIISVLDQLNDDETKRVKRWIDKQKEGE